MSEKIALPPSFLDYSETRKNGFLRVMNLKENGGKVAGIFCTFTPLEILDAAGFTAVSLCGMSDETINDAEKYLPKNLCPLIKSSFGFMITDKCPYTYFADLIVGETTCDGKKKMYEEMANHKRVYILHLPQGDAPYALDMWHKELVRFGKYLEDEFGVKITNEKLNDAIKFRNKERVVKRELLELNKQNPAISYGKEIYSSIDATGFLFESSERINKINQLKNEIISYYKQNGSPVKKNSKRILVTGCPIGGVLDKTVGAIERAGGVVVAFENCAGVKACLNLVEEDTSDPLLKIAERYLKIGCAVMTPNSHRMQNLKEMINEFSIDGVVDISLHACTPYLIESSSVKKLANSLDKPYLHIETDYSKSDSENLRTRLEAFLEM